MDTNRTALKNNNSGFTLLEVMIGIILLAIMSVPIYRGFATSAQTNARAKSEGICTIVAENLMEDYRSLSTEDLNERVKQYEEGTLAGGEPLADCANCSADLSGGGLARCSTCGTINLKITSSDEMGVELPTGYYAKVILDPQKYEKANSLNISDFGSVSPLEAAIYTCKPELDDEAVDEFIKRNEEYAKNHAGAVKLYKEIIGEGGAKELVEADTQPITNNMVKDVNITLSEVGKHTKANGDEMSVCKVDISIRYSIPAATGNNAFESTSAREYVAEQAYLFNNVTSKRELTGVYYFFNPRDVKKGNENITIINNYNIETNVYLVAQGVNSDPVLSKINVLVVEDWAAEPEKAAITLRTNMLKTNYTTGLRTPYNKDDVNSYAALADISYKNKSGVSAIDVEGALDLSDIDGKKISLDDDEDARIYRLKVFICNEADEEVVEMSGSKLNGVY